MFSEFADERTPGSEKHRLPLSLYLPLNLLQVKEQPPSEPGDELDVVELGGIGFDPMLPWYRSTCRQFLYKMPDNRYIEPDHGCDVPAV